jgi:rabenosyn-5
LAVTVGDKFIKLISKLMSYISEKLTNPAFQFESENVGFLRRSGSNSSLNSMVNPEGEPHIRTCWDCRALLERRDKLVESRNTRPAIMDLYDVSQDSTRLNIS